MRVLLWILFAVAAAMAVHGVVVERYPDAVVWAFGVIVVALLIRIEKHERDNE